MKNLPAQISAIDGLVSSDLKGLPIQADFASNTYVCGECSDQEHYVAAYKRRCRVCRKCYDGIAAMERELQACRMLSNVQYVDRDCCVSLLSVQSLFAKSHESSVQTSNIYDLNDLS